MTVRQASIMEELDQIEQFFSELDMPSNLDSIRQKTMKFCEKNVNSKFALITVIKYVDVEVSL